MIDNGAPLEDLGDVASQRSGPPAEPLWQFTAAAADDFIITDLNPGSCQITTVRVGVIFFQSGSESATPTETWESVEVTIYPNDSVGGDHPAGEPNSAGGHIGLVHATVIVPASSLVNETPGGICKSFFVVDIPVSINVAKNTKYWLSVVPIFPAPPQSFWCVSQLNGGNAKFGFPPKGIPYWTDHSGNLNHSSCAAQNPPPAGTNRDFSFVIFAEDAETNPGACCHTDAGTCDPVMNPSECNGPFDVFTPGGTCPGDCAIITGACCDDTNPPCVDGVNIADCQGPNQRFSPGAFCDLDPPCGTTDPGACCLPNGSCDDLTPLQCYQQDGVWHAGDCITFSCPPLNDACVDAMIVTDGLHNFVTLGATTDGPAELCSSIDNDIWFSYTATCDGTLTVDLCTADYDSAVAVYGCPCPVAAPALACNDNACATASYVTVPVTNGNCYLIRVGGSAGASGTGQMVLACTPTGFGACCHSDLSCDYPVALVDCMVGGDVYSDGQPCSLFTCAAQGACCLPDSSCQIMTQLACAGASGTYQGDATVCTPNPCPPTVPECCPGDIDNNCAVEEPDIPGFVDSLLEPPLEGTPEFCRADVNQDGVVDGRDVAHFLEKLLSGAPCDSANCPPPNDACANAIVVTTSVTPFDTGLATTDGPVECSALDNDIWFEYTATCDGTMTVDLCSANYDSAVAVYDGCGCPVAAPALDCNDNACGTASYLTLPVTNGNCYLIRVGGTAGASGTGQMTISCIPTGSGACCHANQDCEVLPEVDCSAVDDVYTEGQPCSPLNCPPIGACCVPATPCQLLTETECGQISGTYQGDSTTCTPDPCPPLGACCLAGPSCQETTATECSGLSGVFQGDGTVCTPNPCGPTAPECCVGDMDESCTIGDADVELFVNAVLDPPLEDTPEFCRADVNLDGTIDGLDVAAFLEKLMAGPSCEQTCCPGDTNGDGQLDGLDLQGLVDAYLLAPACGSAALCRADVDGNDVIEFADVDAFVNLLMTDVVCP